MHISGTSGHSSTTAAAKQNWSPPDEVLLMAQHNIEFLHKSILGERAGALDARTFSPVSTDAIGLPEYRNKYFETFPSAWAAAYAFTKLLRRVEKVAAAEVAAAVREWVTLFALHYSGAYVTSEDKESLEHGVDPDFGRPLPARIPAPAATPSNG